MQRHRDLGLLLLVLMGTPTSGRFSLLQDSPNGRPADVRPGPWATRTRLGEGWLVFLFKKSRNFMFTG